jgi:hypothetical protein
MTVIRGHPQYRNPRQLYILPMQREKSVHSWPAALVRPSGHLPMVAAALVGGALIVTRSLRLGDSLTNDEAYTLIHYARTGPRGFLAGAYVPNNHVLFSALTWLDIELFGANSEVEYRLWGIVPGVASVAVVAGWMWWRLTPWSAVGFMFFVLVSPLHGTLAWQARGYGLGFLSSALMLVSAAELARGTADHERRWLVVFASAGAVGILTLPILVLAFIGCAVVLVSIRRLRRSLIGVVVLVGATSLVAYSGLWRQVLDSRHQRFGRPLPWHGAGTTKVEHLLLPTGRLIDPGIPAWVVDLGFWALALAGTAWLVQRTSMRVVLVVWAPYVLTAVVITAARVYVEPRFISYLLFGVLVLVVCGIASVLDRVRVVPAGRVVAIAGVLVGAVVVSRNYQRLVRHEVALPIEDYRSVAAIVDGAGVERVVVNSDVHVGFEEYLGVGRVIFPTSNDMDRSVCASTRPVAYVEYTIYAAPVHLTCTEAPGVVTIEIAQQNGWPDRPMRVWLIGLAGAP